MKVQPYFSPDYGDQQDDLARRAIVSGSVMVG